MAARASPFAGAESDALQVRPSFSAEQSHSLEVRTNSCRRTPHKVNVGVSVPRKRSHCGARPQQRAAAQPQPAHRPAEIIPVVGPAGSCCDKPTSPCMPPTFTQEPLQIAANDTTAPSDNAQRAWRWSPGRGCALRLLRFAARLPNPLPNVQRISGDPGPRPAAIRSREKAAWTSSGRRGGPSPGWRPPG
jgi:hypothetical protein